MKIRYALALAAATGLGLGTIASHGLSAKAVPPIYVVVEIDEIIDADAFEALRKTGPANVVEVKDQDGRYLARTDHVTALDGNAPKYFVFIAFDNLKKAKTFNDNIKQTTALRMQATRSRSFIVEGL
jgi:uncharacterized protein (DUF1330 family)